MVDSQPVNFGALARAMTEVGLTVSWSWFYSHIGLSSQEMLEQYSRDYGITLPVRVETLIQRRNRYFLDSAHKVRLRPMMGQLVEFYRGVVPLAIASGGAASSIKKTIELLSIGDRFDVIVTRDDVSRGKPHPDIFLRAAAMLRVEPHRCLVYEDADEGIEAGMAAGMRVIDIRPYIGSE